MRKVLGADRAALIRHFMLEAILTCAIATFFGLVLAEIGLPLVNAAGGLDLRIRYLGYDGVVAPLAILVIVIGSLSGFYPALVLARFPAAAVLASARSPGGGRAGNRIREALVVLQFALATAFMIGTAVLVAQTRHSRTADLGFPRDGLMVIPSLASADLDQSGRDTLVHVLATLPGVTGVTIGNGAPGDTDWDAETNVAIPGAPGSTLGFRQVTVGADYFRVLGAHLVAGRVFDSAHPGDDSTNSKRNEAMPVVIDTTAAKALGFATPQAAVGRTIGGKAPISVVGVINDLSFLSPRLAHQPTRYEFHARETTHPIALVRFTGDPRVALQAAGDAWRKIAPQVPFEGKTAVQNLDRFYSADDHAARLFGIGAGLAVLIGCVGLWGLASFNTARRIKEIGIRKTLGASATDIVVLLTGQFLRPVLIANLLAWPLAYGAMRIWLSGFSDPVALSPFYFLGASVLALVIAVLTVLGQSLRTSRAAPAWALRHE
jgi:putative ABC transport system permease protein